MVFHIPTALSLCFIKHLLDRCHLIIRQRSKFFGACALGKAIAEAAQVELSRTELERLQRIVIGDSRFVPLGLRAEGGFVGDYDRRSGEPIPEHISARAEDLPSLVDGIVAVDKLAVSGKMDSVVAAATIAFGFVYVHILAMR